MLIKKEDRPQIFICKWGRNSPAHFFVLFISSDYNHVSLHIYIYIKAVRFKKDYRISKNPKQRAN